MKKLRNISIQELNSSFYCRIQTTLGFSMGQKPQSWMMLYVHKRVRFKLEWSAFPEKTCFRFYAIVTSWEQDRDSVVMRIDTILDRVKKVVDCSPAVSSYQHLTVLVWDLRLSWPRRHMITSSLGDPLKKKRIWYQIY